MIGCATALVLLLDVSASIEAAGWTAQRDGHAAAFRAVAVQRAVARDGLAVTLIQWDDAPRPVLAWRVLRSEADAERLAADIGAMPRAGQGGTMTGLGLMAGLTALESAPCGEIAVIDLVTDGEGGGPIDAARSRAERDGVQVNALAVQTLTGGADPVAWLRARVVTAGGFAIEAQGWGDFAAAMRRKLILEVSAQ